MPLTWVRTAGCRRGAQHLADELRRRRADPEIREGHESGCNPGDD